MPHWSETVRIAEDRHEAHLWHMDPLARAGRHVGLTALSQDDVHARRRLNRLLYEEGRDEELRKRAQCGDDGAVYLLRRLLSDQGGAERRAVG